jgi:hypothetical protein
MENKLETCHHCGEEKEDCYHGYIAMTIPIPEAEALIEKWNLIDAYENYKKAFNEGKVGGLSPMMKGVPDRIIPEELFIEMIKNCNELGSEEFSKKWFTKEWWKNLERTDLTEEEMKELDGLATYDQLLNTVGRGIQCDECALKEAKLYNKYYPESLES